MAKNKPKNTEHDLKSELHKKPAKPVTKPAVNLKTQQRRRKRKNQMKRKETSRGWKCSVLLVP